MRLDVKSKYTMRFGVTKIVNGDKITTNTELRTKIVAYQDYDI
jgi:hypothetical protein